MHVLMLGIGADILGSNMGEVLRRHMLYARSAGRLTMVVSSFRHEGVAARQLSAELLAIPTNSLSRPHFLRDAYRIAAEVCTRQTVDLVVTQDPFATGLIGQRLRRRFNVPLVIGNHSQFLDNSNWLAERPVRHRLFNLLAHRLIHRADALRVVNTAERAKYLRAGIPAQRIWLLPTPVPLERFLVTVEPDRLTALRRQLGITGRMLLWVGNPAQRVKDLPTLLAAFARVIEVYPDTTLVLVGDFSPVPSTLAHIRALPIANNVRIAGRVAHADLPVWYQAADLYVHSSRYEGLAKVMVEAATSGVPIVTTAVPGVEAVVVDGVTGALAPVGDAAALADRIHELLRDETKRSECGVRSRQLAIERFSYEHQVGAIVDMWRTVVTTARAPRSAE
jgi:glycosyltransferase involved in cell wall biosynthesis